MFLSQNVLCGSLLTNLSNWLVVDQQWITDGSAYVLQWLCFDSAKDQQIISRRSLVLSDGPNPGMNQPWMQRISALDLQKIYNE